VSPYKKDKTNLDFTEAGERDWQWHRLGHMQVCTSLQTDNHASTPSLSFVTGWMPFLPPNQEHQNTSILNLRSDFRGKEFPVCWLSEASTLTKQHLN